MADKVVGDVPRERDLVQVVRGTLLPLVQQNGGRSSASGESCIDLVLCWAGEVVRRDARVLRPLHWLLAMIPHYEKVVKLFNGPDAHPRRILMARVDCASKFINKAKRSGVSRRCPNPRPCPTAYNTSDDARSVWCWKKRDDIGEEAEGREWQQPVTMRMLVVVCWVGVSWLS